MAACHTHTHIFTHAYIKLSCTVHITDAIICLVSLLLGNAILALCHGHLPPTVPCGANAACLHIHPFVCGGPARVRCITHLLRLQSSTATTAPGHSISASSTCRQGQRSMPKVLKMRATSTHTCSYADSQMCKFAFFSPLICNNTWLHTAAKSRQSFVQSADFDTASWKPTTCRRWK